MTKLSDYQSWVDTTATPRVAELGIIYAALGLAGETGETVEKVKKIVRDQREVTDEDREYFKLELGDICWYICRMANELGLTFEEILESNMKKINDRKINGKK